MDINKKILEIIREKLPETVSGELKDYIEQAQKDQKYLSEVIHQKEILHKTVVDRNEEIKSLKTKLEYQRKINERLEDIEKREKDLEINELKIRLEEADKRSTIVKDLVKVVFSNQDLVINKSGSIPIYRAPDQYNSGGIENHYTYEDTTIKKVKE